MGSSDEGGGAGEDDEKTSKSTAPPAFKKRTAAGKKFRRRGRAGDSGPKKEDGAIEKPATSPARDISGEDPGRVEGTTSDASDGIPDQKGGAGNGLTTRDRKTVSGTPGAGVRSDEEKPGREGAERGEQGRDEDEDEEDGSRMDILTDLREEQRARRKSGGRSAAALMGKGTKKASKDALVIKGQGVDGADSGGAAGSGEAFGLKPEVKAPNISTMIQSQFKSGGTGGWGGGADAQGAIPHEQLMEQYVKEKMGGDAVPVAKGDREGEEDPEGKGLSEEDKLYYIPEEFKKKVEEAKKEFNTGAYRSGEMEGEVGSGAQIAWNTGIAEIALPIDFKLRNMEDTLKARDKMERERAARKNAPGENSSVTGSLTANYSHHQREWALQIRALQQRQAMAEESQLKAPVRSGPGMASTVGHSHGASGTGGGAGGGGGRGMEGGGHLGPGGVKLKHSSDNAVLERFKKRTRRF